LRIEWCKAYARVRRWREEVRILQEEWRRFPISLAHEASTWDKRAGLVATEQGNGNPELLEGKIAYANKQRDIF
ncbi:hypothetical protein C8F01DRAFT_926764, partial [Mycena amicta]